MSDLTISAKLLRECRDLAASHLAEVFPSLMDSVDDALFDLADKGENNKVQTLYFDAMREVRLCRDTIESNFKGCLKMAVDQRLEPKPAGRDIASLEDSQSLLLIEDDELEESLAVNNMAAKIRSACKAQLFLLDKRAAFLLDEPRMAGEDNPLGPEVVCEAFRDACRCIEASIEVKLLVLKLFDRFAVNEMGPLYDALNEHLVKRDVLPDLRQTVEIRRNPAAPAGPAGAPGVEVPPDAGDLGNYGPGAPLPGAGVPVGHEGAAFVPSAGAMYGPGGTYAPAGTAAVGGHPGGVMPAGGPGYASPSLGTSGNPTSGVPLVHGAGAVPAGGGGAVSAGMAGASASGAFAGVPVNDAQAVLSALQGLMRSGGAPAAPGPAGDVVSEGVGINAPVSPAFVAGLTSLQSAAVGAGSGGGGSVLASGAVHPTLDPHTPFDLRALKGSGVNDLLGLDSAADAGIELGNMDEMLIDIVAMMFDFILDDANLPTPMKALLGRLQIPVLKVAIIDRSVFSRRFHPARKLLNAMAEAAFGWDAAAGTDDALYKKMDELIHRVLDEFDDDINVFTEVHEALEAFLSAEAREREERVGAQAALMGNRKRLDAAKDAVKAKIRAALSGVALSPIIKLFITRYWGGNLVVTHMRQGAESEAWQQGLATMEKLIWSVTPKDSAEERKALVHALPGLLKRVNEGIEKVTMPPQERDELVAALASCHAEVVRGPVAAPQMAQAVDPRPLGDEYAPSGPVPATGLTREHLAVFGGDGESQAADLPPAGADATAQVPTDSVEMPSARPFTHPEQEVLTLAISRANRQIFDTQANDPSKAGMGTTIVAAVFRDNRVHFGHVGDSRLYRMRRGQLEQLTKDHSLAQELIDQGVYTPEEAAGRVNKNLVTRGLGVETSVMADIDTQDVEPNDVYLLCSDGLTDMVEPRQLEATFKRYQDQPEALVDALIKAANENGGKDNISVLIARIVKPFPLRKRWYVSRSIGSKIQFAGRTDVGRKREHNEDSIAIAPEVGTLIVADGMGGLKAGEVASAMAVRALMEDLDQGVSSLGATPSEVELADVSAHAAGDADGSEEHPSTEVGAQPDSAPGTVAIIDQNSRHESDENGTSLELPEVGTATAEELRDALADTTDPVTERMLSLLDRVELDAENFVLDGALTDDDTSSDIGTEMENSQEDDDLLAFTQGLPAGPGGEALAEQDGALEPLQVGAWIEFEDADDAQAEPVRARLSWINRANGMYLFTDRRGLSVSQRSAESLVDDLESGAVRILDAEPLYDRAVNSLLERLQGEPVQSMVG